MPQREHFGALQGFLIANPKTMVHRPLSVEVRNYLSSLDARHREF